MSLWLKVTDAADAADAVAAAAYVNRYVRIHYTFSHVVGCRLWLFLENLDKMMDFNL